MSTDFAAASVGTEALETPLVSAVIATHRRPSLVTVAIESALKQSLEAVEVVVVVDGPDDPETIAILEAIEDPRFRFVVLPTNLMAAGARNEGVKVARAPWVAFLDDDDEWLPEKLEKQLALAIGSRFDRPIVASRLIADTDKGSFVWPERLPEVGESIGDYLFIRDSLFQGERMLLTSTLFVARSLLLEVPFVHSRHEDYDWLLRAGERSGVGLEYVPEAMAIWHFHEGSGLPRLSQIDNWKQSLAWIRSARALVSPQAYSTFIVQCVCPPAAAVRDWSAFRPLLKEFVFSGRARRFDYALFLAMWFVPKELRHRVRSLLSSRRLESSKGARVL